MNATGSALEANSLSGATVSTMARGRTAALIPRVAPASAAGQGRIGKAEEQRRSRRSLRPPCDRVPDDGVSALVAVATGVPDQQVIGAIGENRAFARRGREASNKGYESAGFAIFPTNQCRGAWLTCPGGNGGLRSAGCRAR
jgi:hypothetical protein